MTRIILQGAGDSAFQNMDSDDKGFEIIFTHRTQKPFDKLRKAFYAAWVRLNANEELMIKITFERRPIYQVIEKAE